MAMPFYQQVILKIVKGLFTGLLRLRRFVVSYKTKALGVNCILMVILRK